MNRENQTPKQRLFGDYLKDVSEFQLQHMQDARVNRWCRDTYATCSKYIQHNAWPPIDF